ncbi:MAG: PDZ domain-containing protein, partial [Phycisphaerales bacterium]|nr:PDZ domain-containing protein [Phycisphaerales bacterium]
PMTREVSRDLGYRRHIPGVRVMEVVSGGIGGDAGIEVGDILTEVDGRQIEGVDDLRGRLIRSLGVTTIELVRGRMRGYVEVELE